VAQQQVLAYGAGGPEGASAAAGDAMAAMAGGLMEAVGGGRKRRAGKLQAQLPWEEQQQDGDDGGASDGEGGIPAAVPAGSPDAWAAAGQQAAAPNGPHAAGGPTLADHAAAEAEGYGYETPAAGATPAKLPLTNGRAEQGSAEEGEDSNADLLSPGGFSEVPACLLGLPALLPLLAA
jgi:hypothetical protein